LPEAHWAFTFAPTTQGQRDGKVKRAKFSHPREKIAIQKVFYIFAPKQNTNLVDKLEKESNGNEHR